MSNLEQHLSRLEKAKEWARRCAKRAYESSVEKIGERSTIGNKANATEPVSQKLNVYSVLLLLSSDRLIIELLSQKLNVNSVLLLISSERLIIELLNQKLNIYSVLLLVSSEKLIVTRPAKINHLSAKKLLIFFHLCSLITYKIFILTE